MTMSEYVLYGMFAEHVLGERARQYLYSLDKSLYYWERGLLSEEQLSEFKKKLSPDDVAVQINEKARIPADRIRRVFAKLD